MYHELFEDEAGRVSIHCCKWYFVMKLTWAQSDDGVTFGGYFWGRGKQEGSKFVITNV
jgi:hypothetical protein